MVNRMRRAVPKAGRSGLRDEWDRWNEWDVWDSGLGKGRFLKTGR